MTDLKCPHHLEYDGQSEPQGGIYIGLDYDGFELEAEEVYEGVTSSEPRWESSLPCPFCWKLYASTGARIKELERELEYWHDIAEEGFLDAYCGDVDAGVWQRRVAKPEIKRIQQRIEELRND